MRKRIVAYLLMAVGWTQGIAAPILFQHIASSTNPIGVGIPGHAFVFHTESLPPNTVAVMGVSALSNITVAISDTLAGSWSAAVCGASGGAGNTTAWVFVQPLGASGGTDTITIDVGPSDTQPVQFDITFWQNISTSSPANGSLCAGHITPGAGGAVSPGSFTPTMNNNGNGGNLIWNYTPICTGYASSNPTSWVPATGFSLLNGDIVWTGNQGFPEASQYYVQTTQATVTPSITASGDTADCFNSASVALRIAGNGASAPSSIHVVAIGHESFTGFSSPGTMNIQAPWIGNLRVLAFPWLGMSSGEGPYSVTAILSSDGCNFTETGGDQGANVWYAQGCSPCPTCMVSLIWTGGGNQITPQASFRYYDVQNAQAASFQNAATSANYACGTSITGAPTFTPTGATSGLVIQALGNGNGPITGFAAGAPPGAVFDLWTFADQNDTDVADNADASAHLYYSSAATENWNFVKTYGDDLCYDAAAAFSGSDGGAGVPPAPTGLTAVAGDDQVALQWTATAGATGYNVYQGTTSGGESPIPIAMGVTGTSITITGLSDGTTYYFYIVAIDAAGNSMNSQQVSATPGGGATSDGPLPTWATGLLGLLLVGIAHRKLHVADKGS